MVQSVFFEMYQSYEKFDRSRGDFKTWLFQHAYGRSIARLKHLNRRHFYQSTELDALQDYPCSTECHDKVIENRQEVEQALSQLKGTQQEIMKLAHFEGYSLREISDRTGEKYETVRHHYYRGLRKMRVTLEGHNVGASISVHSL
jgi:RNA polymerase sigma-70 factor (ECF subfamily)